jgi:hypothetical protein
LGGAVVFTDHRTLVVPLLIGTHTIDAADLALGIEAGLTGACTGIAIGLLCSRLVIRRQGYALIAALAPRHGRAVGARPSTGQRVITPTANATRSVDLLGPVGGLLAIAVVILIASSLATQFIATRGD